MIRRIFFLFVLTVFGGVIVIAQSTNTPVTTSEAGQPLKPKLVVGIVVDQMRWDYLYRYKQLYSSNGFKRLLNEGFSCDNTFIPYTPTYTAPGHTCIYTGSVPAIHGIVANNWYDKIRTPDKIGAALSIQLTEALIWECQGLDR